MNLYRGCVHDCAYCDGRSETYNVRGDFSRDIEVKINAPALLEKELDPRRKRKPMPKSFVMVGGGVTDTYQPAERKYGLTRRALEILLKHELPVHILTKSHLVERDIDLLQEVNGRAKAIVSFSFSSVDKDISRIFETGAPSPARRLGAIEKLKSAGIACGMFLMPVIPFITDTPAMMEETIRTAKEAGIDFIIFGVMTLKAGRQKDYFDKVLFKHYPQLIPAYEYIYSPDRKWGEPSEDYIKPVHEAFSVIAQSYEMPVRIPPQIYEPFVDENDKIIIGLEHLDYKLKLKNQRSPYGFAAYSLSKQEKPIKDLSAEELLKIKGIGPATVKVIRELQR